MTPGWEVVTVDAEDIDTGLLFEIVNVIPAFGPRHEPSPDCWCHPAVSPGGLIVHEVMH